MTIVPFAEFAPDSPDLTSTTNIAQNVIPRTASSYGPMNSLARYSSLSLPQRCSGLCAAQNVDESINIFAGTDGFLLRITGQSTIWDVLNPSGTIYNGTGELWRFAQYNALMLATDFNDPIQSFNMTSSTAFGVLSANAPKARFIAVAKTFTIVGNTNDPVGGFNPARLWWSAAGDPTNWPTPGSPAAQQVQSDYSDMVGPQGDITGLVPNLAGCDCAIFFQRGVYRMSYVGPPDVFDFYPAENVRGTRYSNAIVPLGNLVYYLGEDGFYVFDGNSSVPIGVGKVDKWFFENLNESYSTNIVGTSDVVNKLIMWLFPSTQSGGVPDTLLVYRWDIQRWSYGEITAQWAARLLTTAVTVEGLQTLGYATVESVPFSMDSKAWLGGAPQTGFIDRDGYLAFFGPTPLEAQIGTQVAQITPDRRSFVQSARPLVDGGSPTVALSARQNYFDTEVFGADVPVNVAGECPQRSPGRYHRARVTVPSSAQWNHAYGVDVTAIPEGTR